MWIAKFLGLKELQNDALDEGARVLRDDRVQAEGVPVPLLGLGGRGHAPAHLQDTGETQVICLSTLVPRLRE